MPSTVTYPFYNHDYEKSIKLASENLKKRSLEHPNPSQPVEVTGMTIRHDYLLLAVSYELSGQVERAYGVYSMLYGWLPEMTWASLRLGYAIEQGKCPRPVGSCYDIAIPAYRQVCEFVPTLPLPSIDAVVRRVNIELDDCKSKRRAVPCDFIDWEAIHLYRLRDNCARIVCPDLHYREAPSHTNNDDRVLCIRTRIAYSKFMKYMEEHYAKHMTTEGDRDVAEQATKTMEILRKIAELPY